MQYICSEKPMRWPDKVTALYPLTHRIVFANAPHCVFLAYRIASVALIYTSKEYGVCAVFANQVHEGTVGIEVAFQLYVIV